MKQTAKHAFISCLPVMAGYLVLGMGFGMLLYDKGYSYPWAVLMSVTIFAGSMQYVGVGLLASGASVISTALMTLMVNARHLFYGISMVDSYKGIGKMKPYLIFGLTDETYSLVCGEPALPEGVDRKLYYLFVTLFNHCYWVTGSFLGAFVGSTFNIPTKGVDFSMTALFTIIVVEQWEKRKNHLPAILGAVVSFVCLLIFGPDRFLIPSMAGITAGLFLLQKFMEEKEAENAD